MAVSNLAPENRLHRSRGVFRGCSAHGHRRVRQHPSSASSPGMQPSAADAGIDLTPPSRGLEPPSKLSPALQRLSGASDASRGLPGDSDADAPPSDSQVGSPTPGTSDNYEVAIRVTPGVDTTALQKAGANIQSRLGNLIYASVHARDLQQVADVDGVTNISPLPASLIPAPPKNMVRHVQRWRRTRPGRPRHRRRRSVRAPESGRQRRARRCDRQRHRLAARGFHESRWHLKDNRLLGPL